MRGLLTCSVDPFPWGTSSSGEEEISGLVQASRTLWLPDTAMFADGPSGFEFGRLQLQDVWQGFSPGKCEQVVCLELAGGEGGRRKLRRIPFRSIGLPLSVGETLLGISWDQEEHLSHPDSVLMLFPR